jgi:glucan endo-1,3-alpha-glucosidase
VQDNAYAAAANTGFKLFISFDYAANPSFGGNIDLVSGLINTYKTKPAQFTYNSAPLVSTFEGPDFSSDWSTIKSQTGAFFVPDYTSQKGNSATFANADGALSWDIWPTGASDMTDDTDTAWQSFLGTDKIYMMGISPWFYSNLPDLSKTWTWRGAGLWHSRWTTAAQLQPQLIEIVTWNDFGESHYIGPIVPAEEYTGSSAYVTGAPHDAWRLLLPAYISAYKNGNSSSMAAFATEDLIYAHKPNSAQTTSSCSPGAVVGNAPYQASVSAAAVSSDTIDVYVLLNSPADSLSVTIGSSAAPQTFVPNAAGVNYFSVPFNGAVGPVVYEVVRAGQSVIKFQGATISPDCNNGQINFNAVTGSFSSSASS